MIFGNRIVTFRYKNIESKLKRWIDRNQSLNIGIIGSKLFIWTFIGSILWMWVFGFCFVWWTTILGKTLGVPAEVCLSETKLWVGLLLVKFKDKLWWNIIIFEIKLDESLILGDGIDIRRFWTCNTNNRNNCVGGQKRKRKYGSVDSVWSNHISIHNFVRDIYDLLSELSRLF